MTEQEIKLQLIGLLTGAGTPDDAEDAEELIKIAETLYKFIAQHTDPSVLATNNLKVV